MRAGGGGYGRRRPSSTGSGDGGGSGSDLFTPGQDGNLAWNGTQPIGSKPILVYVFNGHIYDGSLFDYSKRLETELLKNPEVIKEARDFICEKVCIGDHELLRKVKGREAVTAYLAAHYAKPEQRKVQLFFLDSTGALISVFNDPKAMKEGAPALLREMRKAKEANVKRLAELAAKKPADGAPPSAPAAPVDSKGAVGGKGDSHRS